MSTFPTSTPVGIDWINRQNGLSSYPGEVSEIRNWIGFSPSQERAASDPDGHGFNVQALGADGCGWAKVNYPLGKLLDRSSFMLKFTVMTSGLGAISLGTNKIDISQYGIVSHSIMIWKNRLAKFFELPSMSSIAYDGTQYGSMLEEIITQDSKIRISYNLTNILGGSHSPNENIIKDSISGTWSSFQGMKLINGEYVGIYGGYGPSQAVRFTYDAADPNNFIVGFNGTTVANAFQGRTSDGYRNAPLLEASISVT